MQNMRYLIVALFLAAFWVLLSGHFTALLLSFGVVSVVLVVWFLYRMDRADKEPSILNPTGKLLGYIGWLLWAVAKANVDVAKRIWHPRLRLATPLVAPWARR